MQTCGSSLRVDYVRQVEALLFLPSLLVLPEVHYTMFFTPNTRGMYFFVMCLTLRMTGKVRESLLRNKVKKTRMY